MDQTFKYAFTVTLKPSLYIYDAQSQYDRSYAGLYKHLKGLSPNMTLIAEVTKNFNVHYHGIITFPLNKYKEPRKAFVDSFRRNKIFGFVNIRQIDDEMGWKEYLFKSLLESRQLIDRPPIIIDVLGSYSDSTLVPMPLIRDDIIEEQ